MEGCKVENNRGRAVERVIVILHKPREQQVLKLSASLSLEGITCRVYRDLPSGEGFRDEKDSAFGFGEDVSRMNTVIITDDRGAAARLSAGGFICIGCEDEEGQCGISGFFEGAALVTDTLETLDADILEECLLRGTGRPVTVAYTQRLVLREITAQDAPRLYQISTQKGMEAALAGGFEDNFFRQETLLAYIGHAYRFFGYGIWGVWKKDGPLIGCCGFSQNGEVAELQYMLDEAYRRMGYGTEMCAAALSYAAERTDWQKVYVRIAAGNEPSLCLAKKLGFQGNSLQGNYSMLEYKLAVFREERRQQEGSGETALPGEMCQRQK